MPFSDSGGGWYWILMIAAEDKECQAVRSILQVNKCINKIFEENRKYIIDTMTKIVISPEKKEWYLNEKLHRENDKPAIEDANGYKVWYFNGKRHRENEKPAIERENGDKFWFINGFKVK